MKKNFLALIFCTGILLTGCGEEVAETKPPLVKVEQVKFTSTSQEENYSGTIQGRYEKNLAFQDFIAKCSSR